MGYEKHDHYMNRKI